MRSKISIRKFRARDLKFVLTLCIRQEVFNYLPSKVRFLFSYILNLLFKPLGMDTLTGAVAEANGGRIIGAIISRRFPLGKSWVIGPVVVHSIYRRLGIATSMMNFVMDLLKKNEAKGAMLAVPKGNLRARKFFEKCGFMYLEPIFVNHDEARYYNQKLALIYGYFRNPSDEMNTKFRGPNLVGNDTAWYIMLKVF